MGEGFGCAGEGCSICDDRIPDMADWDSPLDICFCCGHVHNKPSAPEASKDGGR